MKGFTVYDLVEMIKAARADARALKEIRVRKEMSLTLMEDLPKWKENLKKEQLQSVQQLKELERMQWETVAYIQSEIDTFDGKK